MKESPVLEQISLILEEELSRRGRISLRASGTSMLPLIQPNARIVLERCDPQQLRIGDIVCYKSPPQGWVLHRLYAIHPSTGWLLLKGDWRGHLDPPVHPDQVLGRLCCVEDSPWPAPLWKLFNQLLIWGVARPVAWLVGTPWGRERLHQLKQLSRPALFLERARRRLVGLATGVWRGYGVPSSSHNLYRLHVSEIRIQPGRPCFLLSYKAGTTAEWSFLLERIKHDHFGWGAGALFTPGPDHPGWDLERDRAWIDFLLLQGFVVHEQGLGVSLQFVF